MASVIVTDSTSTLRSRGADAAAVYAEARTDLTQALSRNPKLHAAHLERGGLLVNMSISAASSQREELLRLAVVGLDEYVLQVPADGTGWSFRGHAHYSLGFVLESRSEIELALRDYEEAMKREEKYVTTLQKPVEDCKRLLRRK